MYKVSENSLLFISYIFAFHLKKIFFTRGTLRGRMNSQLAKISTLYRDLA